MAARAQLIDRDVLGRVGFTDHAIQRFAQRAGFDTAERRQIEPIVHDLLVQEGRVVARPPRWYRSSNVADRYLQTGEWLLFICRASRRRAGSYDVVTVVTNGERTTWAKARKRGLIFTPPPFVATAPRRRRAGWTKSIVAGLRLRRESSEPIGRLTAIFRTHRERRRALAADRTDTRAADDAARRRHQQEREQAHARHVRMWGG